MDRPGASDEEISCANGQASQSTGDTPTNGYPFVWGVDVCQTGSQYSDDLWNKMSRSATQPW